MSTSLSFLDAPEGTLTIGRPEAGPLWTYQYISPVPADNSPRPVIHPLYSLDGDILTNWRPNDHPWHQGVNFSLTSVDGVNFWGGPSHRAEDSYQWRDDQGQQRHVEWLEREPGRIVERLEWLSSSAADAELMFTEKRTLGTTVSDEGWTLDWETELTNVTGRELTCHNYHSMSGLVGSHYTGLQFRGARGLLDEHGDPATGLRGEDGESDVNVLHGREASSIEWHSQIDSSLERIRIRFESPDGPIAWFVRPENPLTVFPPHKDQPLVLAADSVTVFRYRLHFLRA